MPAVTYFTEHEAEAMRVVPMDKEVNDLLLELRSITGEDWIISVGTYSPYRSFWQWLLSHPGDPAPVVRVYSLYVAIITNYEYQIINLQVPQSDSGSVFVPSAASRAMVMNFMMGYINGYMRRTY